MQLYVYTLIPNQHIELCRFKITYIQLELASATLMAGSTSGCSGNISRAHLHTHKQLFQENWRLQPGIALMGARFFSICSVVAERAALHSEVGVCVVNPGAGTQHCEYSNTADHRVVVVHMIINNLAIPWR